MIFFNVPEARGQLLGVGFVYTLRPKMRRTGNDTAIYGSYFSHQTVGKVSIEFIKKVGEIAELREYIKDSGFAEVGDWWRAAKGSRFLFKVRMR